MVKSHRIAKDRMMEEIFRWLLIGFIAAVSAFRPQAGDCVDFEFEKLVPYCEKSQEDDKTKCKSSGEESRPIGAGFPYRPSVCSADNQCICIIPESQLKSILGEDKSWCFNSSYICCTDCRKANLTTTSIATTTTTTSSIPNTDGAFSRKTSSTSSTPHKPSEANLTTTSITTTTTTTHSTPTPYASSSRKTSSTSSVPHKPPKGQLNSSRTGLNKILIVLILLVVVVFIIVAVVLFMRKRKSDKRNEWSPTTYTSQGETVTNVYADNGTSGGTAPAGNHIYDELDVLTLDPTPSNVYSTQPTSVAVDMGRSADYVDIDLPMKDQQKPMSTDKAALSLSPVYSQPFEPSANNTEYAEPFKPDTTNTATAPFPNHNSAAGDQQNDVYFLATAIPLSDPNVIYSQPNKPIKSYEPTGEVGGSTDPIHSETIGVVPGAGGVVTQDPNAVYAEPMKLKKSS